MCVCTCGETSISLISVWCLSLRACVHIAFFFIRVPESFSIGPNEERASVAACSHLKKKSAVPSVLFQSAPSFLCSHSKALLVENVWTFQKGAGVVTVAFFQSTNYILDGDSTLWQTRKWRRSLCCPQQRQKSPFVSGLAKDWMLLVSVVPSSPFVL